MLGKGKQFHRIVYRASEQPQGRWQNAYKYMQLCKLAIFWLRSIGKPAMQEHDDEGGRLGRKPTVINVIAGGWAQVFRLVFHVC